MSRLASPARWPRLRTSWPVVLAALALATVPAPARSEGPCTTAEAVASSLCRADRPFPVLRVVEPVVVRLGGAVTMEASGAGRGSRLEWDLDNDGAFDDATGSAATITADSNSVVAVRETDQFGRVGTAWLRLKSHAFNVAPTGTLTLSPRAPRVGHPVTLSADATDVDGQITRIELDTDGDGTFDTDGDEATITFPTEGARTLRTRFTDDAGAVATSTLTVDVHSENIRPHLREVVLRQRQWYEQQPLSPGEVIVTASADDFDDGVASFEFDLDGDGEYELSVPPEDELNLGFNGVRITGPAAEARTTLASGVHEIGVRAIDAGGGIAAVRRTAPVLSEEERSGPHAPIVWLPFTKITRPGRAISLSARGPAADAFVWDADGDGDFDDGNGRTISFTYATPGEYAARVKASNAVGSSVAMTTVSVRPPPAAGPVLTLSQPLVAYRNESAHFAGSAIAPDGDERDATITADFDGDGVFSNSFYTTDPERRQASFRSTPVTSAVKATDSSGRSTVRTVDVTPSPRGLGFIAHWTGPQPWIAGRPYSLLPDRTHLTLTASCCPAEPVIYNGNWRLDGAGARLNEPTRYTAGEHTVTLYVESSEDRRTFTVGTLPPDASFTTAASTVTSTSTDPDADPVSIAWDLDGDRDFDDASGPSARALPGTHLVGVAATDAGGDIGISYASVTGDYAAVTGDYAAVTGDPPPKPTLSATAHPRLRLTTSLKAPKLATLLKRGLTVTVNCTVACKTTATATVDRRTAKTARLRSTTVARATANGRTVRVKLTAAARRGLKRLRTFKLRVALTSTSSGHGRATVVRTLTIRR